MLGPFRPSGEERSEPTIGAAVQARAYARHYLTNALIFWGSVALLCLLFLGATAATRLGEGDPLADALLTASAIGLVLAFFRGSGAVRDLLEGPVPFEGSVAGKSASLFWNRLAFLEDKYYLRLGRGSGMRPLSYGTGHDVPEGWFLAGRGYYEILAAGDAVRGTLYRRTRLIATLVKLQGPA